MSKDKRHKKHHKDDATSSDSGSESAQVWHALRIAHDRIESALASQLAMECDLGLSEFDALASLSGHDSGVVAVREVASAVNLSQPALSRLLARLEGSGFITRERSTADARSLEIGLTMEGRELASRALSIQEEVVNRLLNERLSRKEQKELGNILSEIAPEAELSDLHD